jgi:hypothetical protein
MQTAANRLREEVIRLRKMAGSCDSDIEKQLHGLITEMQTIASGLEKVDEKMKVRQGGGANGPSS